MTKDSLLKYVCKNIVYDKLLILDDCCYNLPMIEYNG
jgi:hypothetical protein